MHPKQLRAFFALIFLPIFSLIALPRTAWVHPETASIFWQAANRFGLRFSSADFLQAFNYWDFDRPPRARFLSHLGQIWTVHLRPLFFSVMPAFPSFSVTWLLGMVILPYLVFRITRRLSGNISSAWIASIVYFASVGNLSNTAVWFHPAKAFSILGVALCLLMALCIRKNPGKRNLYFWILLWSTAFLFCFADEKAWFVFAAVPLCVPDIFLKPSRTSISFKNISWLKLSLPPILFALFLLCVWKVIPAWTDHIGIGDFPFFSFADPSSASHLTLTAVLGNIHILLADTLSWASEPSLPWTTSQVCFEVLIYAVLLALFLWGSRALEKDERASCLHFATAAFFFSIFHALIQTRHAEIQGAFYYGSLFCLFACIPIGLVLGRQKRFSVTLVGLLCLIGLNIGNFVRHSEFLRRLHQPVYATMYPEEAQVMSVSDDMEVGKWWMASQRLNDLAALEEIRPGFPLEGIWLFQEARIIDLLKNGFDVLRPTLVYSKNSKGAENAVDLNERTGWQSDEEESFIGFSWKEPMHIRELDVRIGSELNRSFQFLSRDESGNWQPIAVKLEEPFSKREEAAKDTFAIHKTIPRMQIRAVLPLPDKKSIFGVQIRFLKPVANETKLVYVYDIWSMGKR